MAFPLNPNPFGGCVNLFVTSARLLLYLHSMAFAFMTNAFMTFMTLMTFMLMLAYRLLVQPLTVLTVKMLATASFMSTSASRNWNAF